MPPSRRALRMPCSKKGFMSSAFPIQSCRTVKPASEPKSQPRIPAQTSISPSTPSLTPNANSACRPAPRVTLCRLGPRTRRSSSKGRLPALGAAALRWAPSSRYGNFSAVHDLFEIVHESNDFLVINKPAGLVCHPTKGDVYSSLISRVRLYLGEGSSPQMVNRLDRETSGIILIAKTDLAALELRRIWEDRSVEKRYLAIVHGHVSDEEGTISAPLGKDLNSVVAIKDAVRPDGARAETEFIVLNRFVRDARNFSLLGLHLL